MQPSARPGDPQWDAIIIGGGPAGASVAAYLAREGHRVLLLERERFPREHIGESLLPGVLPYLDALGVRDTVEQAGFERKEGQTFVWGGDRTPWELDFRELDTYPYAYFVDRAKFDHLLLRHAASSGAEVREGARVSRVMFDGGRATGVVVSDAEGREHTEHAAFVVDASGQSAVVARGANLRRNVRGLKNVALWSYWTGHQRLPGHQRAHILTVSIPEGWIWAIPLADRLSVGIVTSGATRTERDAMGAAAWYEHTLRSAEPVWALLRGATQVSKVTGARDWSYRSRRFSGPGIFLVGDAACFIDPILSTGVHLAMSAAFWAAACIHTSLRQPKREAFFRRFYDEQYATTYRELLTQVKAFYQSEVRRDSVYWASKKVLRAGNSIAPDRAFLFITAGLLRNAATARPHDPVGQARIDMATTVASTPTPSPRAPLSGAPEGPAHRSRSRTVSPPLVWRVGNGQRAELVTLRAEGLTLQIVPHAPQGLHDRPRDSYFVLDLMDAARRPLALAVIERASTHAPRPPISDTSWCVSVLPYPVRPHDPARLEAIERTLGDQVRTASLHDDSVRAVRASLRRALRRPGALVEGITHAPSRALRGGGVSQPALSAVYTVPGAHALERVYLVLEARLPVELSDLPVVRTRYLDVWIRPDRAPDGGSVNAVPGVQPFLDRVLSALWHALVDVTSASQAFARASDVLHAHDGVGGFALVSSGRLGGESA